MPLRAQIDSLTDLNGVQPFDGGSQEKNADDQADEKSAINGCFHGLNIRDTRSSNRIDSTGDSLVGSWICVQPAMPIAAKPQATTSRGVNFFRRRQRQTRAIEAALPAKPSRAIGSDGSGTVIGPRKTKSESFVPVVDGKTKQIESPGSKFMHSVQVPVWLAGWAESATCPSSESFVVCVGVPVAVTVNSPADKAVQVTIAGPNLAPT